jgi:hypothetical protein
MQLGKFLKSSPELIKTVNFTNAPAATNEGVRSAPTSQTLASKKNYVSTRHADI